MLSVNMNPPFRTVPTSNSTLISYALAYDVHKASYLDTRSIQSFVQLLSPVSMLIVDSGIRLCGCRVRGTTAERRYIPVKRGYLPLHRITSSATGNAHQMIEVRSLGGEKDEQQIGTVNKGCMPACFG